MEDKHMAFISVVCIIAIVAVTVLVVNTGNRVDAQKDVVYVPVVNSMAGAAAKTNVQDNGHIWEVLKQKGLQGTHYTLNIHGKDQFNRADCTAVPDPITGEYGNSLFVPSDSEGVNNQILMKSGNVKGRYASSGTATWGVRDSCTAAFDGDAAELVIPPNEKGYYVVARVLGKPTDNPSLALEGDLVFVQDETGADLLVLGLVTDNGFQTPSATLTRAKGNVAAVDITGLFNWNGAVCYFDGTNYCYDETGANTCATQTLCCADTNGDLIRDSCVAPITDAYTGLLSCDTSVYQYALTTLSCQTYTNEWVFNIGDMVGYMWDTYTDGSFKLANIRFYPVQ